MNAPPNIEKLKTAICQLVSCENQYDLMHIAVHSMYEIYCKYTNIDAHNQNDDHIELPTGKAISPAAAAHCLLEMVRTTKFLRGINQAIQHKLKAIPKVKILYAGCGPYAALITPLFTLFSEKELEVDLLDVNKTSLNSSKRIISGLGFEKYIDQYFLDDASSFNVYKNYDIVISETLQSALRTEPFVAIYKNLVPQTKPDCLFIPEEVLVELKMNTMGDWNPETLSYENQQVKSYGEVLKVNKQNVVKDLMSIDIEVVNPFPNQKVELKFHTIVNIYQNEVLSDGECSLNIPIKLNEISEDFKQVLHFQYSQKRPVEIQVSCLETEII